MKLLAIRLTEDRKEHIARHSVEPEEVEEVIRARPLIRRGRGRGEKKSYQAFGQTAAGRYLFVVFRPEPEHKAFIITARDMTGAERKRYREVHRP